MTRFRCYDNQGTTADRYTVITVARPYYSFFSSANPSHPQGVWSAETTTRPIDAEEAERFGRRVTWGSLPEPVRRTINWYLAP